MNLGDSILFADNARGVLTGLQSTSNGALIQDWAYDYDALGNMKFRTDSVVGYTENFQYDNLNRLTQVQNAAGVLQKQYQYDAIGNITYKSDVGSYAYDANHPHAVATAGGNTYTYDVNGNMLTGAGRTHSWTSFNKAKGIWTANGYTGFEYDASHNRITKTSPTSTTTYIGKIFQRTVINGVVKETSHIYAGSKLIASIEDVAGITNTRYMHGDHLGSISVITDEWGAVVERLRFDVFGAPVNLNGTAKASIGAQNTDRGYTGHEMDASTGLINMNARLYDPVLGRFISADTVVPSPGNMQGFNRYAYVLNNPLAYTDPTGHWSLKNLWRSVRQVVVVAAVAVAAYFTAGYAMAAYQGVAFSGAMTGGTLGAAGGASFGTLAGSSMSTAMVGGFAGGAMANAAMTAAGGGNLSQIATAGLIGGVAGAIGAGIGFQVGASTNAYFGKMVGQAANAGIQSGGDLRSMGRAFAMAGAAAAMNYIYESITGVAPTFEKGRGLASPKGNYSEEGPIPTHANVSGTNTPLVMDEAGKIDFWHPDNFFRQGGPVSTVVNGSVLVPAGHGISVLHEFFQIALGSPDSLLRNLGNIPGMGVAAAITYGGLMHGNPAISSIIIIDRLP